MRLCVISFVRACVVRSSVACSDHVPALCMFVCRAFIQCQVYLCSAFMCMCIYAYVPLCVCVRVYTYVFLCIYVVFVGMRCVYAYLVCSSVRSP